MTGRCPAGSDVSVLAMVASIAMPAILRDDSCTFCTAGKSRLKSNAMMATTTRSSIKVKLWRRLPPAESTKRAWYIRLAPHGVAAKLCPQHVRAYDDNRGETVRKSEICCEKEERRDRSRQRNHRRG